MNDATAAKETDRLNDELAKLKGKRVSWSVKLSGPKTIDSFILSDGSNGIDVTGRDWKNVVGRVTLTATSSATLPREPDWSWKDPTVGDVGDAWRSTELDWKLLTPDKEKTLHNGDTIKLTGTVHCCRASPFGLVDGASQRYRFITIFLVNAKLVE
jgi:hypothetical protein